MEVAALTPTEIAAAASSCLVDAGYTAIGEESLGNLDVGGAKLYEDEYGVAMVCVYPTWSELHEGWPRAQSTLVELMSAHMSRSDMKAWEGYLVLLTPGLVPEGDWRQIDEIRYNTSRVRKLVGAGEALSTLGDVGRTLRPLLSLDDFPPVSPDGSVLDLIPGFLVERGIERDAADLLVGAFRAQRSLMEALHGCRGDR